MPRPANLVKVTIVGTMPQGESFQTGWWLSPVAANYTQAELQELADLLGAAFEGGSAGIRALTCPEVKYTAVRLYHYPTGGTAPSTKIAEHAMTVVGTGTEGAQLPLQIACVATLKTAFVGRSYSGRMYWPVTSQTLGNHQLSQATIDAVATDTAGLLQAANEAPGLAASVVMSSTKTLTSVITRVNVDSRCDVQRRRAEQQAELRQSIVGVVADGQ